MEKKTYLLVVTTIFSIITVLHVLRLVSQWEAMIGGWTVPMWFSWIFVVVGGWLAYTGFKLSKTV